MPVALLTTHYPCDSAERREELERCLEHNSEVRQIDRIVVFSSGAVPSFKHVKIEVLPVRRRPTWGQLLGFANTELMGSRFLIAHADICFDESLTYMDQVDFSHTALVIGCRENSAIAPSRRPFHAIGFRSPVQDVAARLPIGGRGAEGRLAYELQRAKYTLRDVSEPVNAVHLHRAAERSEHPRCRGRRASVVPPVQAGPKVFGIGLQRTGTSSLRRALNTLDIPTLERYGSWFLVKLRQGETVFDPSINHSYFQGFVDSPVPLYFRELDAMFPNSKFVFTTRDRERWLDSVERLFQMKPYWDEIPEGALFNAFHRASYGVESFDRRAFAEGFDRHEERVRTYFENRPQDLLVLDAKEPDKWGKLCHFLGRPVPDQPYPRINRSRFTRLWFWRLLTRRHSRPREFRQHRS